MPRDRFTTFGLLVALLGWIVVIGDAALTPFLTGPGTLASVAALRSDVFSVAETTIVSGFALALLGTLRSGFGGLHRFFAVVLDRAGPSRPAAAAAPAPYAEAPPVTLEPEMMDPVVEPPARPAPARTHNYTILANGAVEVETLLGTRVFASLDEARDFIR